MATQCQDSERAEAIHYGLDIPTASTLLWTAKEALSKTLCTGLMCPFTVFNIHSIMRINEFEFQGLYKNFTQYKFHSWIRGRSVLTMTLPKWTEIVFETGQPCLPETRILNESSKA